MRARPIVPVEGDKTTGLSHRFSSLTGDDPICRLKGRQGLRLGIMGGAFDPIHMAHLVTAEEALTQFGLDQVIFMPAGHHPQKPRRLAPNEFRYLLVSVATAGHHRFVVSRYELDRQQVGYTVDTLEYLKETLAPDAQVYFVTGADAVLDILTWKDPVRVLELSTLIAATRPGYDLARLQGALSKLHPRLSGLGSESRVQIMEIPALAISSSMIRDRLASGRTVRYLVPDPVAQLIEKAGYYAGAGPTHPNTCTRW
ncbi:MAG: nicotinate-nucleotide adenylyltransferase [Thermoleophilia bacterium]|jgi:nicotinate-nucleotide adenylyltransferase